MRLSIGLCLGIFLGCISQPAWAKISVSNTSPVQGETIEVTWPLVDENSIVDFCPKGNRQTSIVFNGHNYRLFCDGTSGQFRCLLAIPADLKPGEYSLGPLVAPTPPGIAQSNNDLQVTHKDQIKLMVKDAKFPVQHLTLPKTKNNFNTSPGEEEAINKAKAELSDKRLWDGVFTKPSEARISSVFGIRRVVNGQLLKDYYHSGIDFAGNLGSPVKACADGKVILAHHNFKLHGNVIALDHGQGVITIYIHLQKIMVKEGDIVKVGQQIGAVGQTGRANGPHLHLSLYVNQVAANPMPWFTNSFIK